MTHLPPFTRLAPHVVPRLPSAILADLIDIAEETLAHALSAIAVPRLLKALRAEVERLVARPCEGERIVDDAALWLVQALEHVVSATGRARAKWTALARALLEEVRADAAAVMEAEARPAPAGREAPR